MSTEDIRELGRRALEEYHLWAARAQSVDPDRIRIVGYLSPANTVDELLAEAQKLIGMGFKVLHINAGSPPAKKSPADPELDPVWALLEKHRVPLVTHVGSSEIGFFASSAWSKAPAFAPGKVVSHELGLEPYTFATLNFPISNFLTCLTLGGVFERFPGLIFGAIEVGASWFGPLVESLDMWARDVYATRLKPFISELPSEYMRRNVRVTPFNNFEPIEEHLARYPHLQDCYAFSTDYPHFEGGVDIQRVLEQKLSAVSDEVRAKFFRHNAEILFQ